MAPDMDRRGFLCGVALLSVGSLVSMEEAVAATATHEALAPAATAAAVVPQLMPAVDVTASLPIFKRGRAPKTAVPSAPLFSPYVPAPKQSAFADNDGLMSPPPPVPAIFVDPPPSNHGGVFIDAPSSPFPLKSPTAKKSRAGGGAPLAARPANALNANAGEAAAAAAAAKPAVGARRRGSAN